MFALLVALAIFVLLTSDALAPEAEAYEVAEVSEPVVEPQPDYTPLWMWIEGLHQKESSGRTDRFRIVDVNGKYSYGCLQFQMATFVEQTKKFNVPIADYNEDIYSCVIQKKLAFQMILDNHNAWRHWYTSVVVKGLGVPPVIR